MNGRFAALVAGLVFGAGLVLSGMTRPSKVQGFLDIAGQWDPSLMFVMVGAIGVHFALLRLIQKRSQPLFDERFHLPTRKDIDVPLIAGSVLFGVGWGLGGFCPGPAVVSLGAGVQDALIFCVAMMGGITLRHFSAPKPKASPNAK